jgi:hypothetical protein
MLSIEPVGPTFLKWTKGVSTSAQIYIYVYFTGISIVAFHPLVFSIVSLFIFYQKMAWGFIIIWIIGFLSRTQYA